MGPIKQQTWPENNYFNARDSRLSPAKIHENRSTTDRKNFGGRLTLLLYLLYLFPTLLEPSEEVLYEDGGVEPANCDLIRTRRWYALVE